MREGTLEIHARRRCSLTAMAVIATLLAIAPAAATASTLTPNTYTAAAGETNNLTVTDNGTTFSVCRHHHGDHRGRWLCARRRQCPRGARVVPGDVQRQHQSQRPRRPDELRGNIRGHNVTQAGGAGDDTLRGPDSTGVEVSNVMDGGLGSDLLAGGSNPNDQAIYNRTADVTVTLDDVANDGEGGESDNVRSSVEDVVTGTGNDTITGSSADNSLDGSAGNDTVSGGAGDDLLQGDAGDDTLSGEAGDDRVVGQSGNDALSGGDGNDMLEPGLVFGVSDGADDVRGGAGADSIFVYASGVDSQRVPLTATLDDIADDGIAGEGDNFHSDIEDVDSSEGISHVTIVGNASPNILTTSGGDDSITGGAGNDVLTSGGGNDTLSARDGFADRVNCGTGVDVAIVDTLDVVGTNCETVDSANVGNANDTPEDAPPTVAFVTPAENALIRGGPSTVTVNATDDKGIARVVLIDDGRVVGVDTTAPYAFTYQPKATDVGKNTLIAQAVDAANQTATAVRTVRVDRFNPRRVSQTVTPSRDRTRPFRFRISGTVSRPAGVTAAQGCRAGTVRVTAKAGTRTRFTRNVRIRANCTYAVTARIGSRGRLRFTARFSGNTVLKARNAATRTARAG